MWRGCLGALLVIGGSLNLLGCSGSDSGPRGPMVEGQGPGGEQQSRIETLGLRTVIYLPNYKGDLNSWGRQLSFANISYVNLSFLDVQLDGTVSYVDAALPAFVNTAHAAGTKVCVAVGGATTIADGGVFATLLMDDQRPKLVSNLVKFVEDNKLDCLDIDLEGNGVNAFYEAFVVELAARLKPQQRELTAAVAGWFAHGISAKALEAFDFINVMAYDLYNNNNSTPMQTSSIEDATAEVEKWVSERGVPREKVVYGVPFYGFRWSLSPGGQSGVTVPYADLVRLNRDAVTTQDMLQGDGTITYLNSRATIQAKTRIGATYGGIMAWEGAQDASGEDSLLSAIREAAE
jgi:spore germination protein YaaH